MIRKFPAAALLIVASLFCLPAQAATFDFVALAAGNEHGAPSEMFTSGGFTLTTSAYILGGGAANMYLDDLSGGPGGLGVCRALTAGNQCTPSDDDNVTQFEVLVLTFDREVTITNLTFSNGNHQDVYSGHFGFAIDGSAPTTVGDFDTSNLAAATFNTPLTGTTFYFISPASVDGPSGDEGVFYISSVNVESAPEPATLALISLSLGLIAGGKRFSFRSKN